MVNKIRKVYLMILFLILYKAECDDLMWRTQYNLRSITDSDFIRLRYLLGMRLYLYG